jgi:hypothetical protein
MYGKFGRQPYLSFIMKKIFSREVFLGYNKADTGAEVSRPQE